MKCDKEKGEMAASPYSQKYSENGGTFMFFKDQISQRYPENVLFGTQMSTFSKLESYKFIIYCWLGVKLYVPIV